MIEPDTKQDSTCEQHNEQNKQKDTFDIQELGHHSGDLTLQMLHHKSALLIYY